MRSKPWRDISIRTIIPCHDKATFHEIVQRYLHVLVSLGMGEPTLISWGQHLPWSQPEEEHVVYEWPSLWGKQEKLRLKSNYWWCYGERMSNGSTSLWNSCLI